MSRVSVNVDPVQMLNARLGRIFGDSSFELPFHLPLMTYKPTSPALNVWEEEDKLVVEAELPGVAMENVEIQLQNRELTIAGERKLTAVEGQTNLRQERGSGRFSRTIKLPIDVASDAVTAKLAHGVLTVFLPKSEAAKSRKISITGA